MDKSAYATEHIANALKTARQTRELSQRELGTKVGVPQGHISRVEKGAVDLRLSSLVALARALDLELTLVPRHSLSAVKSIVRNTERPSGGTVHRTRPAIEELTRLKRSIAYAAQVYPAVKELAQLLVHVRDLARFPLAASEIETLHKATEAMDTLEGSARPLIAIRETLSRIRRLHNALVHTSDSAQPDDAYLPAYRLDEDDDG